MRWLAALLLTAVPAMAVAGPYDGIYRQAANSECALVGVDGGALKIENGIFYGVDMECRMTRPVDVIDMDATLYTMQCSGEADQWSERSLIMNAGDGDGIIMLWNGYAFRYERCPE